jgi:hypothetical protein
MAHLNWRSKSFPASEGFDFRRFTPIPFRRLANFSIDDLGNKTRHPSVTEAIWCRRMARFNRSIPVLTSRARGMLKNSEGDSERSAIGLEAYCSGRRSIPCAG